MNCTATGEYAPPDTVNITAHVGKKSVISGKESHVDSDTKTNTTTLTIPWQTIQGKDVEVFCEVKGERKSNPITTSSRVKVLSMFR